MELKRIKKTVMVDAYMAKDGKIFHTREKCEAYEEELDRKNAILSSVLRLEDKPPLCGGCDDEVWEWYHVANEEQHQAVLNDVFCNDASAREHACTRYPCWILCQSNSDGYGCVYDGIETLKFIFETYIDETRQIQEETLERRNK